MASIKRGFLLTIGAVATAAAATYFGDQHLQQRAIEIEANLAAEHEKRRVVVANRELAPGETLTSDVVALREIPITYLPKAAVSEQTWPDVAGGTLTTHIGPGEPLLPSQIQQTIESRLADRILPGDRAITIPVSGTSAVAGLLEPGDRVDLMLTINETNGRRTLPLLGDVPIVATGGITDRTSDDNIDFGYTDITLAVSTLEAAKITHAQVIGDIRPILRNDKDDAALPNYVIDRSTLFAGLAATAHAKPGAHSVELIIGGQR